MAVTGTSRLCTAVAEPPAASSTGRARGHLEERACLLFIVVSYDPEHLALFLSDQLMKRDTRLTVVRGVDGTASCPIPCFGQYVIDVKRPRHPLVCVGQAGADAQPSSSARATHRRPPRRGLFARAEPGHDRSITPQHVNMKRDRCVLGTHVTKAKLALSIRLAVPLRSQPASDAWFKAVSATGISRIGA
jgi:hypothetical protein